MKRRSKGKATPLSSKPFLTGGLVSFPTGVTPISFKKLSCPHPETSKDNGAPTPALWCLVEDSPCYYKQSHDVTLAASYATHRTTEMIVIYFTSTGEVYGAVQSNCTCQYRENMSPALHSLHEHVRGSRQGHCHSVG